jgi:hypothetical protein
LHHLSKRAKRGGGKDNYRSARHEEDSSGNGPEDRIVCQTARIDRPGNEGSHRNQQGEEEKALVLTSASLRACDPQLLIDDFHSGLLEGTLHVSLRTHFSKTAPLHGNSDVPQSIPLTFLMEALKHLETFKEFAIYATITIYGCARILRGRRLCIFQRHWRVGGSGLQRIVGLLLQAPIARRCSLDRRGL